MIAKCLLAEFVHLPEDRDLLNPNEKSVFTVLCFHFSVMLSAGSDRKKKNKPLTSSLGEMRLARPLSNKTCIIAAKLSVKLPCYLKDLRIRSNAGIVCHEQTSRTPEVAGLF